jgi:dihydrolipoamide dehydrogenase
MEPFDIIVIGSGPGGYIAAIRSAQLGYNVAIVEKYNVLGGTCTNVGCIPSKALLDASENYHSLKSKFSLQGIEVQDMQLNFKKFIARKNDVVRLNTNGLNFLMKKNKITVVQGTASFLSNEVLHIKNTDGTSQHLTAKYFIIATGSKPSTINGVVLDKKRIISSTEALSLPDKPSSMIIIGGGVIGVEMASIYSRIGTSVTILEYADSLIPTMDRELGKELQKTMNKNGVQILTGQKVQSAVNRGDSVTVTYLDQKNEQQELHADYCLVAVGRKPYTEGLGLEHTRVKLDEKGRIKTNEQLQTDEPHIYAIGDVIKGPMLAHKAEEEGVFVAEGINGQKPHINYELIPGVVYTWPEVASVGYSEEQLKEKGIPYRKGKFPFSASGRARAAADTDGFTKVLTGIKYGEILGVHIIGARAADLIAQAVIAITYEATDEDLFRMSYAHPTYSETLKEAYLIASGQGALNL